MLTKYLDPKNDVAFKKIFGTEKNKNILIHFINDILDFSGNKAILEVEFLSPVQDPEIASKKQSIVDVLCKDATGVQYIIEMQVAESAGFEKRAQYYAAKAYTSQLDKGSGDQGKYANLKEIIFIAIADFILFPEKKEYKSDHIVLDKYNGDHDLKDFYFTFIELPKFTKTLDDKLENMVEKWCVFFKYAGSMKDEDLQKLIEGGDVIIKDAYVALDRFNWTEEELFAYERELKRVWDNAAVEEARIAKITRTMEEKILAAKLEIEAKAKEVETIQAKVAEIEAKAKETEAKAKETEAKAKETEAKAKETEAKAKETEAKAKETEAKAKETEAKAKETEAKAKETGLEEGAKSKAIEIARLMLSKNVSDTEVIEFTGLTEEEIIALKS